MKSNTDFYPQVYFNIQTYIENYNKIDNSNEISKRDSKKFNQMNELKFSVEILMNYGINIKKIKLLGIIKYIFLFRKMNYKLLKFTQSKLLI